MTHLEELSKHVLAFDRKTMETNIKFQVKC